MVFSSKDDIGEKNGKKNSAISSASEQQHQEDAEGGGGAIVAVAEEWLLWWRVLFSMLFGRHTGFSSMAAAKFGPKSRNKKSAAKKWPFSVGVLWRARSPSSASSSAAARDLSASYCEHTWDLERIEANFQESRIDLRQPQKSGGLSPQQFENLFQRNGPNTLPKPKEMTSLELFFRQFWNLLWVMLLGSSTLSLLEFIAEPDDIMNLYITLFVYGMVVVMCFVSWYQEMKARKVVFGFQNLLPQSCSVVRNGVEQNESVHRLVVGDLVKIRNGCRIPADCRIIYANQLKLESSSITGEAEPHDYWAEQAPHGVSVFEAYNIAFNGSLCVDGEGLAVVIRTGAATVIGQIADLTTSRGEKKSRLEAQVHKYVVFLVILSSTVALIVFIVGGFVHHWTNVVDLLAKGFLFCAVGMVPCAAFLLKGLPATITSMLALIAKRLANKHVFLKRLDICEALGQVSIIASDKTGTLTKNQMTVVSLWCMDKVIKDPKKVSGSSERANIEDYPTPISNILRCMAIGTICDQQEIEVCLQKRSVFRKLTSQQKASIIRLQESRQAEKKDTGTPSEMAMSRFANSLVDTSRFNDNVCFEVPFNSRRKWQLAIFREEARGRDGLCEYIVRMKGAPEKLAKICSKIIDEQGSIGDLGAREMELFENAYRSFASSGYRVIGFAEARFHAPDGVEFSLEAENFPTTELTFLGTCAIVDPPRDETAAAIRECKDAGIRVFMVTGDHQLTAQAIAKQIGLIEDETAERAGNVISLGRNNELMVPNPVMIDKRRMKRCGTTSNISGANYEVIHGDRIAGLSDGDWDALVAKQSVVFARTTPEQKLLIVEQCQRRGHLIAMTGDGVNDAPALKTADIGIAMGSGSEVAKQAADIILTNDNFSSIAKAVREGRTMYENIKKLLAYTMPHSFPEVWPIVINFCFGMPQGITALQMLSIDLGTEILPGVSLSKEPSEADVMRRPPRAMNKVLVSNNLLTYSYLYTGQVQSLGCFLAYMCVFWSYGIGIRDLWMSSLTCWQRNGAVFYTASGRAFSVEEQLYINRQACSAWQMGIAFGQFFNIWSARTRRESVFRHGLRSNRSLLIAIGIELLLITSYVYLPGLNRFLGGAPIPWTCWAVVAGFGAFGIAYNELRKFCIRKWPWNPIVRLFKW